jgi:DNA polymerase III subunit epsilon
MKYLCIDLEMSGFEPGWHEIIQIGAVLLDETFRETSSFLCNVCPENRESFSISAEKIHDLSWDELQEAPLIYEALEDMEAWIIKSLNLRSRDELKKVALCGQSVVNDINFLRFAYRQEKMDYPFSFTTVDLYNISYFLLEILKQNKVPNIPEKRSLTAMANFFGYAREGQSHNALEDARLTALCLEKTWQYIPKLKLS